MTEQKIPRICIVENCDKKARCKDMCDTHYNRVKRHGNPHLLTHPRHVTRGICVVDLCMNKEYTGGLCGKHYIKLRRTGSVAPRKGDRGSGTFEQRFWQRVALTADDTRCWEWQGNKTKLGYGTVGRDGKTIAIHRIAWELGNGRPPKPELDVLHSCDNPSCVNPKHLREGTAYDNTMDMVTRGRHGNATDIDTVRQVKQMQKDGFQQFEVRKALNLSHGRVAGIFQGKTFKWLEI